MISGKKLHVKQQNARQLYVPAYEGLAMKDLIPAFNNHPSLHKYFPSDYKELRRLPKQWCVNVMATVVGE